jgi:hypothetical protein
MEKTKVWYMIQDGGDGSASVLWFLTKEASEQQEKDEEEWGGFAESTIGSVETFIGSDIHKEATEGYDD